MDQFERLYAQVETASRDSIFATGRVYLNWFRFLTHSEQFIVDRLVKTYGSDVQLFVHHMMDMEHYYDPGDCYYDFVGTQLDRMKRLVDANKGRLLTFVAWSPKRPNDINIIQRAIDGGIAAGVKVYPPSGYQADEQMNDPLFDFCASERSVPIFTALRRVSKRGPDTVLGPIRSSGKTFSIGRTSRGRPCGFAWHTPEATSPGSGGFRGRIHSPSAP